MKNFRIIFLAALIILSSPFILAGKSGKNSGLALSEPEFSIPAGIYSAAFQLEISASDEGAKIFYTLDGSEPNENSIAYAGPIQISDRKGETNGISMIPTNNISSAGPPYFEGWQPPDGEVFKITVVRARAVKDGFEPGDIATATYILDENGVNRYNCSIISISTDYENLFDPDYGIYVYGNHENYYQRGSEWERPVHMELFEKDGSRSISQNMGIRTHGGTTRNRPRKTLRIYSRSSYNDGWIYYPFFPDKEIARYKRFLLRNSGNDWDHSLFRDALIHTLASGRRVETQSFRPAVVFINGEFWGYHNIRDRIDQYYFETHYGIKEDDLIVLENNAVYDRGNETGAQHYHDMIAFIESSSLASEENYAQIQTMMDTDNFIDTWIANIFAKNTDWPDNNLIFWRFIRDDYDPHAPGGQDGRWRWILFDTDFGFGLDFIYVLGAEEGPAHNTLAFAADPEGTTPKNPPWSTFLFRELLKNASFKNTFINRCADLLNTSYKKDVVISLIDSIADLYRPGIAEHISRWRRPVTMDDWENEIEIMRQFALQRGAYQKQHIMDYFHLDGTVTAALDISDPAAGKIKINSIEIDRNTKGIEDETYPWQGEYFRNVPVQIIALPNAGYKFSGWEGINGHSDTLQFTPEEDFYIKALFEIDLEFDGDDMNPAAFKLSEGQYVFSYWNDEEPEEKFPLNIIFQQSAKDDPELEDEMTHPYHIPEDEYNEDDIENMGFPYKLTQRTRINGLGENGISFINTGRGRDLGAAVLALDTRGAENINVTWTGGTIIPNSRAYAIRLQYRTTLQDRFRDVVDNYGNPVEYMRSTQENHQQNLGPVRLPAEMENRAYVQLRWKYYFTGERLTEEHGRRDMLRLDNIQVTSNTTKIKENGKSIPRNFSLSQNFPNPFNMSTTISFEIPDPCQVKIKIYDTAGRLIDMPVDRSMAPGQYHFTWKAESLASGIYIIHLTAGEFKKSIRAVLLK